MRLEGRATGCWKQTVVVVFGLVVVYEDEESVYTAESCASLGMEHCPPPLAKVRSQCRHHGRTLKMY